MADGLWTVLKGSAELANRAAVEWRFEVLANDPLRRAVHAVERSWKREPQRPRGASVRHGLGLPLLGQRHLKWFGLQRAHLRD
jgi:hypothetical protein